MGEWRMQVAPVGDYEIHYVDQGEGFSDPAHSWPRRRPYGVEPAD